MQYNPKIHHRHSIRLKGYDYSQAGLYFITICVQDRKCRFGKIENDEMIWNSLGEHANKCWLEIPEHFPNVVLHEHIVMPNHVHGIIQLTGDAVVRSRHVVTVQPDATTEGTSHVMSQQPPTLPFQNKFSQPIPGSISVIIQQFKSSVKRWCNQNGYDHFTWHSRFHDHIIRNEQSYQTISNYIINNPAKWQDDKFFNNDII